MAASSATLTVLLVAAVVVVWGGSGAVDGAANNSSALDQVCEFVGGSYVTPELCAAALCYDDPAASPCRGARDYAAVASLAARLLARNGTAARDSVAAAAAGANNATAGAGLRSCLRLYDGLVPALEWAAASVAAGRAYSAARELMQATLYAQQACAGMVAGGEMPRENSGFVTMATVAHAVLSTNIAKD